MKVIIFTVLLVLSLMLAGVIYHNSGFEMECEDTKIINIVSAENRSVNIELSNKKIVTVYQSKDVLTDGAYFNYCEKVEV
jgi:hypothetical protein